MATQGRPRKKITVDDVVREITENNLTKVQIAEKYSVSVDTVERRMKEWTENPSVKNKSTSAKPQEDDHEAHIGTSAPPPDGKSPDSFEETTDTTKTVFLKKTHIGSLEELVGVYNIDTRVWRCTRFRINEWESFAMPRAIGNDKDGWERGSSEPIKVTQHQIRADFERQVAVEAAISEIDRLRKEAFDYSPSFPYISPRIYSRTSGNIFEMSMYDHHFGGLSWGRETGWEDWDLSLARKSWDSAIVDMFSKAAPFRPEKALLILGNDQLNADNRAGMTEKGTQQNMDSRYHKTFEVSREASTYLVDNALAEYGAVHVVMVPGNHDPLSTWHLGDTLSAWYRNCDQVTIQYSPNPRLWFEHGVNMLMFTHGNAGKLEKYPMTMASEQPAMWGRTKWREAHTGDKHHRVEVELPGATVRILPSLRPPCAWSAENHFIGSIRAAQGFMWNRFDGLVGTAIHSILPQPAELPMAA